MPHALRRNQQNLLARAADLLRQIGIPAELAVPLINLANRLDQKNARHEGGAARKLAEYLGPMARILVSRTSLKARSEEELYDLLAMQIDSPKDRAAFRGMGPAVHNG